MSDPDNGQVWRDRAYQLAAQAHALGKSPTGILEAHGLGELTWRNMAWALEAELAKLSPAAQATELEQLRAEVAKLREALDDLIDAIERSPHGETSLHTWSCPAGRDLLADCRCGSNGVMDAARKALKGGG